jgi:putative MATE family efflux protein
VTQAASAQALPIGRPAAAPVAHPSALLNAPIGTAIARLAGPTMAVMVAQAGVAIAETAIIGRLGTAALAGFALVFPVMMLMTMMAAGGIGGGIASAVARALGAGRREDAGALVPHALAIAGAFALLFTLAVLLGGRPIFAALGGSGAALDDALAYAHPLFLGAVAHWAMFALSAAMRGAENAALPGKVMLIGSLAQIPLTYVLVLGFGPWPGFGIAGAALSSVGTAALSSIYIAWRICAGALGFVPTLAGGWRRPLFAAILEVGLVASISAVMANLTTILITFLVGGFGIAAIAAYGVGARLEFLQVPLVFGIGSALTTLVGVAVGAGDYARARRVAWTGAAAAALMTGLIGAFGALAPHAWLGLFSGDPTVLAAGRSYLVHVAPFYVLFGFGMALNFAAQGAGRMTWPFVAGLLRLAVATGGGYLAVHAGLGLDGLFAVVGLGLACFGGVNMLALWLAPWRAAAR